jgi:hypothetical protein
LRIILELVRFRNLLWKSRHWERILGLPLSAHSGLPQQKYGRRPSATSGHQCTIKVSSKTEPLLFMSKKIVLNLALLVVWLPGSLSFLYTFIHNYWHWGGGEKTLVDLFGELVVFCWLFLPHIFVAFPVFIFNSLSDPPLLYTYIFSSALFIYIHIRILNSKKLTGLPANSNASLGPVERSDDCEATATKGNWVLSLATIWLFLCGLLVVVALVVLKRIGFPLG